METFEFVRIEAELYPGIWYRIPDVIQRTGINCKTGMRRGDIKSRVAEAGEITFTLRNDAGCSGGVAHYYTPGHVNCKPGWEVGKRIRLSFGWMGEKFVEWFGRIIVNGIVVDADLYAPTVTVTARDYMEDLAIHELLLPNFVANKRMDEAVPLILANLQIQPQATIYNLCSTTFRALFDTITSKTRALEEINKLAMAELGYVYLRNAVGSPETLVVEGRYTRSTVFRTEFYNTVYLDESLETEDGITIQTENSTDVNLNCGWVDQHGSGVDPSADYVFYNAGKTVQIVNGIDYYNAIKVTSYPRAVDTSDVILFTLDKPVKIAAGETITIKGRFSDPDSKATTVTAQSTVTPLAGTHYNLSSVETVDNGNMNSSCVLTRVYGANGFEDVITNNAGSDGYLTRLQAMGKGIYIYNPIDVIVEDSAAIAKYGRQQWDLNCKYLDDPLVAIDYSKALQSKVFPMRTRLTNFTFVANKNFLKMQAFLALSIGDKVTIVEDGVNISQNYIIQGKDFVVGEGGIVVVNFIVRDAYLDMSTYWILEDPTYGVLDQTTILGF